MNRWLCCGVLSVAAVGIQLGVHAQERIYRCGNEYTNDAAAAQRQHCQLIEGGKVTIVHSNSSRSAAAVNKSSGANAAAAKPAAKTARTGASQVNDQEQKARDNDAQTILQAELKRAQEKLAALKTEWNDGHPTKTAIELRNPQIFSERLEALKANMARQENDVLSIQRELARHKGN